LFLGLHLLFLLTFFGLILDFISIEAVNYGLVNFLDDVLLEYALDLHKVMLVMLTQLDSLLVLVRGGGIRFIVGGFSLNLAIDELVTKVVLLSEVRVIKVLFRGFKVPFCELVFTYSTEGLLIRSSVFLLHHIEIFLTFFNIVFIKLLNLDRLFALLSVFPLRFDKCFNIFILLWCCESQIVGSISLYHLLNIVIPSAL
jgi:hypothetical protein